MYDLYGALIGNLSNVSLHIHPDHLTCCRRNPLYGSHKVCSVPLFKGIFAGRSRTE